MIVQEVWEVWIPNGGTNRVLWRVHTELAGALFEADPDNGVLFTQGSVTHVVYEQTETGLTLTRTEVG